MILAKALSASEKSATALAKAAIVYAKPSYTIAKMFRAAEKMNLTVNRQFYAVKIAVNPQGEITMPFVAVKRIKEKALKIQNAWNEGAPTVTEFRNTKKADFDARIAAGQAVDDEIANLKAQISMKEDERADIYGGLEDDTVDIRKGVEGHKDYGDDSPLFGSMGFVRKSERKSGLTRKIKEDKPE